MPILGDDLVSLGQDLDYYERLATLPEALRVEILSHLRDALTEPNHAAQFFDEEGWTRSVLRYIDWPSFQRDAVVLLERDYDKVARLEVSLSFAVAGWHDSLKLDFQAPRDPLLWGGSEDALPDRIAVLVGTNGSGKSTLLSRLARVIHGSQKDRAGPLLRSLGAIDPPGIGFTRIVNVAYSAFDAFQVPGVSESDRLRSQTRRRGELAAIIIAGCAISLPSSVRPKAAAISMATRSRPTVRTGRSA